MVRPPTDSNICLRCKGGKLLCGKNTCPILLKKSVLKSIIPFHVGKSLKNVELFGASPPGFFVGRYNYPKVTVGPLIPFSEFTKENFINKAENHILDAPELWYGKKLEEIILYRSKLVRSNFNINVKIGEKRLKNTPPLKEKRLLERSQILSMAAQPTDTETRFNQLGLRMMLDNHSLPMGPSGYTDKIRITENVKVHPKVEYCVADTDLKAQEAVGEFLYMDTDVPLSTIQRVFSAGLLGEQKKRKLVPTRWTITAVDDIISKKLIEEIKRFPEINEYKIFEATYLDNHFRILLFPGKFAFEMNEVWAPNSLWNVSLDGKSLDIKPQIMTDYEFYKGRKNYASNITGAYYAARKSVCEYLYKIRRQARIIIFREVSSGYVVPLGVWVIRETVKNAFKESKPFILDNFEDAISKLSKGLLVNEKQWQHNSKLINFIRNQRTLDDFI
ncbi:MAG: Nre family DNA repair protein [Promethearchaeia archaeon]